MLLDLGSMCQNDALGKKYPGLGISQGKKYKVRMALQYAVASGKIKKVRGYLLEIPMILVTYSTKLSTRFLELVSPAAIGLWNSWDLFVKRSIDLLSVSGRWGIDYVEVFVESDVC